MTADEFRNWRLGLGWTQPEAANRLGISVSMLSDYERGTRRGTIRAAPVPTAIALACETLSRRYGKAESVS
jgi:transcriptional regulator with XRE-family HTH domain